MSSSNRSGSAPPRRGSQKATPFPPTSTENKGRNLPPRIPRNPIHARKKESKVRKHPSKAESLAEKCSLAMSRTESVLVSAAGDVLVCRCRRSSTPYMNTVPADSSTICCKQEFNGAIGVADFASSIGVPDFVLQRIEAPWAQLTDDKNTGPTDERSLNSGVSRYEWEKPEKLHPSIQKKKVQSVGSMDEAEKGIEVVTAELRDTTLQSSVQEKDSESETPGILPMPSFDYSHIHEGNNDMIPQNNRMEKAQPFPPIEESPNEEKKDEQEGAKAVLQPFSHGVPVFLSSLSQIRITKVSANPLGAHVLMISAEALLLTYGLNNHGQLGIGVKSNIQDGSRGFVTTPTLVTPLLENGGKTIHCAAGVNHSLVVVSTEGRRLQKTKNTIDSTTSDIGLPSFSKSEDDEDDYFDSSADSVKHHQVYGFGRNDMMKIGLVNSPIAEDQDEVDDDDILLPHRVALHCTVWPQETSSDTSQGIFNIAASEEHSAALVRKPTGDVEVYMWGNASLGALGLPPIDGGKVVVTGGIGQKPTSNVSEIYPLPTIVESLSYRPHNESKLGCPKSLALGPYCSYVLMSSGSCMSFGFSAEGMLGQGFGLRHSPEPQAVFLPPENGSEDGNAIVSLSAGASHVICITENGNAYSWGVDKNGRLGLRAEEYHTASTDKEKIAIEWVPQRVDVQRHATKTSQGEPEDSTFAVKVCGGYDSSVLLMRSGQLLSFGKRSGRLGRGEVESDVLEPRPMHGGLCLFRKKEEAKVGDGRNTTTPKKAGLIRAQSNSYW